MEIWLAVTAIVVTIVGLLVQYFGVIAGMKERLSSLETKVDLFWKVVEDKVTQILKSPNYFDKDLLLDKMRDRSLSLKEAEALRTIMNEEISLNHSKHLLGSILIIARLEGIIAEARKKQEKNKCS